MGGYSRNISRFLRQLLGLYILANSTPRRIINTFSSMGVIISYTKFNEILNTIAKDVGKYIKMAAYNLNGIIIYDNFNFKNYIRKFAGRK